MPFGLHTKDTPGKGRILIVDDEESIRKALRVTLSKAGYDVVEAQDGEKGIEAIGADDNPLMVDVIICDIRMPKLLKQGVVDYMEKPADKDALIAAVERAMACRTALVTDH
ncbi:MAG: response regulator [Nitrospirae bacterium]|nr:MAG: response regulator [Nitrospirota bacterium]